MPKIKGYVSEPNGTKRRATLRKNALARANNACECCGKENTLGKKNRFRGTTKNTLEVDHIKPLSRYPEIHWDTPWNVQVLCQKCNKLKGTKETDYRKNPMPGPIPRDILWVASK